MYPNILDVGCFSHTIDNAGEHFSTPVLDEFIHSWISLFSHSAKARIRWNETTGVSVCSYSDTRWWSRWEVINQVLGDGPLIFTAYDILNTVSLSIQSGHHPNTKSIAEKIAAGKPDVYTHLMTYATQCIQPGYRYFKEKFEGELGRVVEAFKAARLFSPFKAHEMQPTKGQVDTLAVFPFIDKAILSTLKSELPLYLSTASDVSPDMEPLDWNGGVDMPMNYQIGQK